MSKAHLGSQLPLKDLILPIDYQDILFPFYWNKVSGRGHEPLVDTTTLVQDDKFEYVLQVNDGEELTFPKEMLNVNSFTVSTWVRLNVFGGTASAYGYQPIFELDNSTHQHNRGLLMWHTNGNLYFYYGNDTVNSELFYSHSPSINSWMMITLTYSGSEYKLYVNDEVKSSKVDQKIKPNGNAQFYIGGKHWGRLNGKLSNFLISPRAFSEEEIKTIYHYGKPLYDPYNYYSVYG